MENKKEHILVPTDFTKVGECALEHALNLAKTIGAEISLLHVVGGDKDKKAAEDKLQAVISGKAASGILIHPVVKTGNIFDDIGGVGETLGATLIVMGTHGVKGMQHVTGSHAVKVVTNSSAPYIVVQQRSPREGIKRIVFPVDMSKENKHSLAMTIKMAQTYKSDVHLFVMHEEDQFLRNSVKRNAEYALVAFKKNGVNCTIGHATEKKNFVKQFIRYAESIDADLIVVINTQERGVHELLSGTHEREVITNDAQIPVMMINPIHIKNARIEGIVAGF
ncbi:MAG: UspA domain-containing protein [Bacteroidetes bacterium]|nr:MAG: UspA domain-containing protein [Bacteroidota bacterium]